MRRLVLALFILLIVSSAEAARIPEPFDPNGERYPVFDITRVLQRIPGISTAQVYGIGTTACLTVGIVYGALDTDRKYHRELTNREAWEIIGGCVLPGPGRKLLHRLLWNHPEYDIVWPPRNASEYGGENAMQPSIKVRHR